MWTEKMNAINLPKKLARNVLKRDFAARGAFSFQRGVVLESSRDVGWRACTVISDGNSMSSEVRQKAFLRVHAK